MCIIFLFVRVLIFFVYDSNRYGTAAASGKEFSMASIYDFQSLPFVIEGFVWDVLAVPDLLLLLYFFSGNSIMVSAEVSFS